MWGKPTATAYIRDFPVIPKEFVDMRRLFYSWHSLEKSIEKR